jgi:pectin methylesterase-like acyl-CoA thioesterase
MRNTVLGLAAVLVHLCAAWAHAATVPGDFTTIQAAINAVLVGSLPDGTVIDVQPGTYREALVIQNTTRSFNTFTVTVQFSDGTSARGSATCQIRPNTEP